MCLFRFLIDARHVWVNFTVVIVGIFKTIIIVFTVSFTNGTLFDMYSKLNSLV